jgi:ABC-type lipoprotein export system ATPase subunit
MAEVILSHVDKNFGSIRTIKGVDLRVADGEFCVVVGPSGCGKSTLLRLIAGLEDASAGSILIGGQHVTRLPPSARGIAMVFQSYALYPHMTTAENITFGLRAAHANQQETRRRLQRAASSKICWTASPASFRAGSGSASQLVAPSCVIRRSFSSPSCRVASPIYHCRAAASFRYRSAPRLPRMGKRSFWACDPSTSRSACRRRAKSAAQCIRQDP